MNTNAVRETVRLLPPDSPAFRFDLPGYGANSKRRQPEAHARWSEAVNDPAWGWRIAHSHFRAGIPLPPTIQDRAVRRAYFYLRGAGDEMMATTLSLWEPGMKPIRWALQGLLAARDISTAGVALLLELPHEVVQIFADLFFPVRSRGISFLSSLAYPEGRLGAIRDAEAACDNFELTMIRAGREYGWKLVAQIAGLESVENDSPIDAQIEDLERLTLGHALLVGRTGWLSRPSATLQYAKTFVAARRKVEVPKDPDAVRGLSGMSLAMAVNESFKRIMMPQLERQLAVQRGIEVQEVRKPEDSPTPGSDRFRPGPSR